MPNRPDAGQPKIYSQSVQDSHTPSASESLKELMPSEVMVNNYVDDLLLREAEMLFNIQGTFSARPDSFVGGYSNFLNNALQLYGTIWHPEMPMFEHEVSAHILG